MSLIKTAELLLLLYKSPSRHLYVVQLGVAVLLAKFGIAGVGAIALGALLRGFLGVFIDVGIFKIDLLLDAVKEAMKHEEFEAIAKELYEKTTKKAYNESEKKKIRQQYLDIISRIGPVGNTPK